MYVCVCACVRAYVRVRACVRNKMSLFVGALFKRSGLL